MESSQPSRDDDFDARVTSLAALGEPVRRALYRYVVAQHRPVSREQAAEGVGVAHHVAKFHLDRLEDDGLLDVEYSRPPGRTGPGAGRPAKMYRRTREDIAVSLPERQYELAGRLMAQAITTATETETPLAEALHDAAFTAGRVLAENAKPPGRSRRDPLGSVEAVLTAHGYEPRTSGSTITLANCPFHSLAKEHTALVCGLNLDLICGMVEGLGTSHLEARLDPAADQCCVVISRH